MYNHENNCELNMFCHILHAAQQCGIMEIIHIGKLHKLQKRAAKVITNSCFDIRIEKIFAEKPNTNFL